MKEVEEVYEADRRQVPSAASCVQTIRTLLVCLSHRTREQVQQATCLPSVLLLIHYNHIAPATLSQERPQSTPHAKECSSQGKGTWTGLADIDQNAYLVAPIV